MVQLNKLQYVVISQNQSDYIKQMIDVLGNKNIVYVLDRCTDNSEEILKNNNVKYIKTNPDWIGRKTSSSRNLGLSICDVDSDIIFLDGDRVPSKKPNLNKSDVTLYLVENDYRKEWNIQDHFGRINNGIFSCGIGLKRKTIEKIKELNSGKLFDEDLEFQWGSEDVFLGDQLYHINATVSVNNDIVLNGTFQNNTTRTLDALKIRLKKRDRLNVLW